MDGGRQPPYEVDEGEEWFSLPLAILGAFAAGFAASQTMRSLGVPLHEGRWLFTTIAALIGAVLCPVSRAIAALPLRAARRRLHRLPGRAIAPPGPSPT